MQVETPIHFGLLSANIGDFGCALLVHAVTNSPLQIRPKKRFYEESERDDSKGFL